jgi:hypothetical protein
MTDRFERAKRRYTAACEAVLRGDADAAVQCERALAELNAARAELQRRPRASVGRVRSGGQN